MPAGVLFAEAVPVAVIGVVSRRNVAATGDLVRDLVPVPVRGRPGRKPALALGQLVALPPLATVARAEGDDTVTATVVAATAPARVSPPPTVGPPPPVEVPVPPRR